jgi:hypothetical protein
MDSTKERVNPYDWINPIHDAHLFAGRKEELSRVTSEILRIREKQRVTPLIVITGERRVGKTSLLLRIKERCRENHLMPLYFAAESAKLENSWEFWGEVFSGLILAAQSEGIRVTQQERPEMGFKVNGDDVGSHGATVLKDLLMPEAYKYYLAGAESQLSTFVIQSDMSKIIDAFKDIGYEGLVLLLDEAHYLLDAPALQQQIRNVINSIADCGVVFAGETRLSRMFTESSQPFFGQAIVIPLGNFMLLDDVTECALLPLPHHDHKLMSPMTIQYMARLSRGKPNQIRLICSNIYRRYAKGLQPDLNISVDVLDDVLESISQAYEDPDLKEAVGGLHKLNSLDLELLHNMTRYPNWNIQEIVALDESFRGDSKSELAISRRKRCLDKKHEQFVQLGLMVNDKDRYQLVGGEFVSLYLRFLYETRKHGRLAKHLIIGKGPPTLFGETTEKLVRSLAYHFGQAPELQSLVFHHYHRDFGDIIAKVRRRFSLLESLKAGNLPKDAEERGFLAECLSTCELIGEAGTYYLLCLSVRNRDNPREIIQVELYFDLSHDYIVDLGSIFNLLNQQAEDARVLIEGYGAFWVELPDLPGLLSAAGVAYEQILEKLPFVAKWALSSIQHLVKSRKEDKGVFEDEDEDEEKEDGKPKWITLYSKGEDEEAEKYLLKKLELTQERNKRARYYNDLGYIRCGTKLKKGELGRKDLETAIDLHHASLPLTLLNLAFLDLEAGDYQKAVDRIEAVLLLTLSPYQTEAAYLRLMLPENSLGFRVKCEQTPANIIEAAYINLAYAVLKLEGSERSFEIVREGCELFNLSVRLKHAMARIYVNMKRVDLALPIYTELFESSSLDGYMKYELKYFERHVHKKRKGKGSKGRSRRKRT